ncbi:MAG: hypothetical protein J6S92_13715 [Oscillospiraceae bacterium]|nr:hypothetical protein [Oscillospiraceae bacterium]
MNRKELNEIRNHFNPEAKYFTMERVLTAFVDSQRNVRGVNIRSAASIPSPWVLTRGLVEMPVDYYRCFFHCNHFSKLRRIYNIVM